VVAKAVIEGWIPKRTVRIFVSIAHMQEKGDHLANNRGVRSNGNINRKATQTKSEWLGLDMAIPRTAVFTEGSLLPTRSLKVSLKKPGTSWAR